MRPSDALAGTFRTLAPRRSAYLLAVLLPASAAVATVAVSLLLGSDVGVPLLLLAAFLAALAGGFGPGVVATLIAGVLEVVREVGGIGVTGGPAEVEAPRLVFFIGAGLLGSWVSGVVLRARARAELDRTPGRRRASPGGSRGQPRGRHRSIRSRHCPAHPPRRGSPGPWTSGAPRPWARAATCTWSPPTECTRRARRAWRRRPVRARLRPRSLSIPPDRLPKSRERAGLPSSVIRPRSGPISGNAARTRCSGGGDPPARGEWPTRGGPALGVPGGAGIQRGRGRTSSPPPADLAAQALDRSLSYEAELRSSRQAEASRQRLDLLADAGRILGSSLEYEATLEALARLALPALGDCAIVDLIEPEGVRRIVVTASPLQAAAAAVLKDHPVDLDPQNPVAVAIRAGRTSVVDVDDEMLQHIGQTPAHREALRGMGIRRAMVVAIRLRERSIGSLLFATADPDRVYEPTDIAVAEVLAQRAAKAIDNGRLHREIQRLAAHEQLRAAEFESVISAIGEGILLCAPDGSVRLPGPARARWPDHAGVGRDRDRRRRAGRSRFSVARRRFSGRAERGAQSACTRRTSRSWKTASP